MEFDLGPPNRERWFVSTKPRSEARVRLFCFPDAGGAARWFDDWHRRLPSEIEVVAAEPAGAVSAAGRSARRRFPHTD